MQHGLGVVVTGMACLCAAGDSPAAVLDGLQSGRGGLVAASVLDSRALPYPFFGLAEKHFPGGRKHSAQDTLTLTRAVCHSALAEAALPQHLLLEAGIVLGTTAGSASHFLESYAASRGTTPEQVAESASPTCSCALGADRDDYFSANLALEMDVEAHGPRLTVTDACTSGADAIGLAMDLITTGQCQCVLCGGADALSLVPHTGFARLMIYSDQPCRPFDRDRKGLNLGEGAAALVLESVEHARERNAAVLGHVLGYGNASDAHHFTAPHPEGRGLAFAIGSALEQAGLTAADMAFVNAHGTSTRENDKVEGRLLRTLLPGVPVWASKGGTGHTLGAAGALEAVLTLAALRNGTVPASPGFFTIDPEIGFAPTQSALAASSPFALSTSLGFGGGNAALVLGRVKP
ncbi:beta-ketoacyl-[acyl-carrier-protein] synthase family protein [Desulfovibrio sp.]|uniref:beta-ketoacyl-[acyl-carrier-protein] synthase family protein n=1 Tax=Desulfovibrio sp. TaxID=885 RepID=UPI003D147273